MAAGITTDSARPDRDHEGHGAASDEVDTARERIQTAFDPELLGATGTRLVECLTEHMRHVQSGDGPVLNWTEPADLVDAASASLRRDDALDVSRETDPAALTQRFDPGRSQVPCPRSQTLPSAT